MGAPQLRSSSLPQQAAPGRAGLVDRMARILREGRLGSAARNAVTAAVRAAVYRRDEILLFACPCAQPTTELPGPAHLHAGTVDDVAECARDYPDTFGTAQVQDARERLARRHHLHIARLEGRIAHVAWVREEQVITASEVGPGCQVPLERPGRVIYDCWTPSAFRGRGVYPQVLHALIADAHRAGKDAWIYCLRENAASRRGIEKAGFRMTHRMVRVRATPFVTRSRVLPAAPDAT
jgi:RimJ/RimL family protein N-acetyltransferase